MAQLANLYACRDVSSLRGNELVISTFKKDDKTLLGFVLLILTLLVIVKGKIQFL